MRAGDFSELLAGSKPIIVKDPLNNAPFPGNVIPAPASIRFPCRCRTTICRRRTRADRTIRPATSATCSPIPATCAGGTTARDASITRFPTRTPSHGRAKQELGPLHSLHRLSRSHPHAHPSQRRTCTVEDTHVFSPIAGEHRPIRSVQRNPQWTAIPSTASLR